MKRPMSALCGAVVLVVASSSLPAAAQPEYDVIIENGTIVDGSGGPAYQADVAVDGDRIAAIGNLGDATAAKTVDASGKHVAPGFIDRHTHAADGLTSPELSAALPQLAQGVTTVGVNPDGGGAVSIPEQRRDLLEDGLGVNVMQMVPHGSVRAEVMGNADRAPTDVEMQAMKRIVHQGMRHGAFGLSSGTFYVPGFYAENDELIELAKVAALYGGAYTSHIRDESTYSIGVEEAVNEVIDVSREAQIPGIVTHIKVLGPPVWGESGTIIDNINDARADGVQVYADQYPYVASGSSITSSLIPRWAQEGGREELLRRINDPELQDRLRADINDNFERRGGPERLQFRLFEAEPEFDGQTLQDYIDHYDLGRIEAVYQIIEAGGAAVTSFNMSDEDVEAFMSQPWTMTSSDGDLTPFGDGAPHPRDYGTFSRKIETYVQEKNVLDLPEAIRTMTSLPANVFDITDRGLVSEGYYADLTVFDPDDIESPASFEDPHQYSKGMTHVMVNGQFAREDGQFTDFVDGRVLQHGR